MAGDGEAATVYVIDDDPSVQRALSRLLRTAGLCVVAFGSVDDFMTALVDDAKACVVADVRMPGVDALGLPALLKRRDLHLPVIFLTAQDTEDTRAQAQRVGAAGYFRKPVDDQALIDAIHWALAANQR